MDANNTSSSSSVGNLWQTKEVTANYAKFRPHYPPALFALLSSLMPPRTPENRFLRLWDVGTGSGQLVTDLLPFVDSAIATDISEKQLSLAPPHSKVTYRVATAEESGLESESVDVITVAQALHWFNFEKFYRECERVSKPNALLFCVGYGNCVIEDVSATGTESSSFSSSATAALNHEMKRFYAETMGPYWSAERKLIDDEYKTIPFPFSNLVSSSPSPVGVPSLSSSSSSQSSPPLSPSIAIVADLTLDQFMGYLSSWSAVATYIAKHPDRQHPVEEVRPVFARLWPAFPAPSLSPSRSPSLSDSPRRSPSLSDSLAHQTRRIRWPLFILAARLKPLIR